MWLFTASRLAAWCGTYILAGELVQHSDLVKYYYPEALNAYRGFIPYLDFPTSYGPFFPYLSGLLLPMWSSPAAVALLMMTCEIAGVLLFASVAREKPGAPPEALALAILVYLVNPAAVYWSAMMAYNSSAILLCWVLVVACLAAQRYASSLTTMVGGVLAGKFLALLIAPVVIVHPRRRPVIVAVFTLFGLATLQLAHQLGIDLLLPLKIEGQRSTSGNVWFLLSAVVPFAADGLTWQIGPLVLMAVGTSAFALLLLRGWRQPPTLGQLAAAAATIGWLFMLVSKKTFPHYTPMFLLFVFYGLATSGFLGRWAALVGATVGAVGILEPGVWNALRQPRFFSDAWASGMHTLSAALLAADVVLVAGATYLMIMCARAARHSWPSSGERPVGVVAT
jgi:hypothetical protein